VTSPGSSREVFHSSVIYWGYEIIRLPVLPRDKQHNRVHYHTNESDSKRDPPCYHRHLLELLFGRMVRKLQHAFIRGYRQSGFISCHIEHSLSKTIKLSARQNAVGMASLTIHPNTPYDTRITTVICRNTPV